MMAIEHADTRKAFPGKSNDYGNCLYVCRYCNTARSDLPGINDKGVRLLAPTAVIWADHFRLEGECLVPVPGDKSAEYTYEAYDLDSKRKRTIRSKRKEAIEKWMSVLHERPALRRSLLAAARNAEEKGDEQAAMTMRRAAEKFLADIVEAWQHLQRYRAVPEDHDSACHCVEAPPLELPSALREQIIRVFPPDDLSLST